MKRCLMIFVVLALGFTSMMQASGFSNEKLTYVISYKWGLIHKDAGEAVLSLNNSPDSYKITLIGKTKPWADKFFEVRDTLTSIIKKDGFKPQRYTKVAFEGGKYSKDDIIYSYGSNVVGGKATRIRINKDGVRSQSTKELMATGPTYDMLSVFYFLRNINYESLTSGQNVNTTVFSGSKVEALNVRCVGKETIKMRDKSMREAYHIKFRFTTEGKKKSSEDINAWISADDSHIPLLIIGSLSIGQIKCYLTSEN